MHTFRVATKGQGPGISPGYSEHGPQLGSFSNDDGDSNENVKKTIGFLSRFFVHFFAVTARLRRENA